MPVLKHSPKRSRGLAAREETTARTAPRAPFATVEVHLLSSPFQNSQSKIEWNGRWVAGRRLVRCGVASVSPLHFFVMILRYSSAFCAADDCASLLVRPLP
ncbi:hypothetical protein EVAR_20968_1 [Eumeta japonica]|uniref:Uncharacterized protein n=1 Tax=Eumeta variegata TaxID=151549 RepID=A0A4C1V6I5_EUMVA|nr:hypothetical protein EVAR_20968_1 [Eumeta japonica]